MKVSVIFSNPLSILLERERIDIDIDTYRDVVSACFALIPSVRSLIKDKVLVSMICEDRIITKAQLDFKVSSDTITLVPLVAGSVQTSFDSLGNLNIFYGASKAYSQEEMLLSGLNRRIIDSSLFGQATTAFDIAQRKNQRDDGTLEGNEDPTTGFGSLSITSVYNQPIPLHFGLVRTGGAVINSYIKHIQRGGVDSVRVSDYV